MLDFNPYDAATWADPYPTYARLRAEAPVFRKEELGFWALSRHADVLAAHNDRDTFSSAGGVTIEGTEKDFPMLIVKDPPAHRWHRKVISKVFTPRRILALEPFIRNRAGELLDALRDRDEFDLVSEFSIKLPLDVISELLGIPAEDRPTVSELSDRLAARGPESDPEDMAAASGGLLGLYLRLVSERRANPQNDIISMIMNTEVTDDEDGGTRRMEDEEIAFRFLELGFAGHETVAKGIPDGLMAMTRFPDQVALMRADPDLSTRAVEEALRSPGLSGTSRRTSAASPRCRSPGARCERWSPHPGAPGTRILPAYTLACPSRVPRVT
jgi:cytochrome P450